MLSSYIKGMAVQMDTVKMQVQKLKEMTEYAGRKVVLVAKVGSVNYNLDDELSDVDYKVYVLPTAEDLYSGNRFVSSVTGDVDYTVHDVRDLEKQLFKSNVNFVEVLFSVELTTTVPQMRELVQMREDVARMNLPYLYDACFGMMYNKMKSFDKGTKDTAPLVEKYGYCTKSFMTTYRGLDFLLRYHGNGFTSFEKAVRYTNEERALMLAMKHGKFTREEASAMVDELRKRLEVAKVDFKSTSLNEETNQTVHELLFDLVMTDKEGEV